MSHQLAPGLGAGVSTLRRRCHGLRRHAGRDAAWTHVLGAAHAGAFGPLTGTDAVGVLGRLAGGPDTATLVAQAHPEPSYTHAT